MLLFQLTNQGFIGSVFLVSAGFSVLALLGSFYVSISLKGKRMQDVAYEGAHEQDETKEDTFTIWKYEVEGTSSL